MGIYESSGGLCKSQKIFGNAIGIYESSGHYIIVEIYLNLKRDLEILKVPPGAHERLKGTKERLSMHMLAILSVV